jgi:DNA-binding protein HU-beta
VGASVAPVFRAGTGFRSLLAQAGDGAPAKASKSAAIEDPGPKATEKKGKKSAAAASTVTKAVTADAAKSGKKAAKKAANKAAKKAAKKAR